MRRPWAMITILAMASAIAACGADARAPDDVDVLAAMRARAEGASSVRPYDSLTEVLGNVEYQVGDAASQPLTEAVILGRITDVEAGRAFSDEREGSPDGVEVDFDSPDAIWRSLHATMDVDSIVSGSVEGQVVVGFAFDPRLSVEDIRNELVGLGSVILFLNRSPVFDYDPELYGTVSDGALLGVVDGNGGIALPFVDSHHAKELLKDASTVDELKAAAEGPRRVIRLDESGARI